MFENEAKKSFDSNSIKRRHFKRFLRDVKRDLLCKSKSYKYQYEDGTVKVIISASFSQEEYDILKKLCLKEGILFSPEWKSSSATIYHFSIKVV